MTAPHHGESEEEAMTDAGLAEDRGVVDPVAVGPGAGDAPADPGAAAESVVPDDGAAADPVPGHALAGADASLLALIDRLAVVLERSELGELEVAAGGTTIVLRAPSALDRPTAATVPATNAEPLPAAGPDGAAQGVATPAVATATRPSVMAPLTGIFYGAPSPGATAYVSVGDHVAVGQIIGLIEAMKLFNEIKSDLAGRVARVCVENGALVKARQPLIEVEPA